MSCGVLKQVQHDLMFLVSFASLREIKKGLREFPDNHPQKNYIRLYIYFDGQAVYNPQTF
jgi:hypothetical protein